MYMYAHLLEVTKQKMCMKHCSSVLYYMYQLQGSWSNVGHCVNLWFTSNKATALLSTNLLHVPDMITCMYMYMYLCETIHVCVCVASRQYMCMYVHCKCVSRQCMYMYMCTLYMYVCLCSNTHTMYMYVRQ